MEQNNNTQELEEKKEIEPVEAEFETEMDRAKKKRREVIFEMALFLILGILIGITIKTEAVKRVTMGFNDYQIKKPAQSYDVSELKKQLDDEMAAQQEAQRAAQQPASTAGGQQTQQ